MSFADTTRFDRCRERRRRLADSCGGAPVVAFGGSPGAPSKNFAFLTGLAEPRARLLLAPNGVRIGVGRAHPGRDYQRGRIVHSVLFLPPSDPVAKKWGEDGVATLGSVGEEQVGVDRILNVAEFPAVIASALDHADALCVVRANGPSFDGQPAADERWVDLLKRRWFGVEVRDATRFVHELRRVKDGSEIESLRRSVALTHQALDAALARLRPGVAERELEAAITDRYRAAGARHGFDPIVGSGPNACLLHYAENARTIEPGELVLIDTGAMLDGYAADVTRTVPSSGKLSQRQREVYDVVLRAQEAAIAACRPGNDPGDVHAAAFDVVSSAGFGEAFPHGTAHHLGMDVHDVGDRYARLEPGCIITVEPGIYLPDESLGVRIEDDVRVTDGEPEVLSAAIPKQLDDVERWVQEVGRSGSDT